MLNDYVIDVVVFISMLIKVLDQPMRGWPDRKVGDFLVAYFRQQQQEEDGMVYTTPYGKMPYESMRDIMDSYNDFVSSKQWN